ncbi:exodeoxyribonuclease VII large subunit [Litorimonas sp. RW-G-Af-16]|uniref:exodeoxyribonuclease VII large subunit n=1 Tax=Litorimonas sp. RW-G-Af-16 TaxID=3241168 RepID=UPI00390C5751
MPETPNDPQSNTPEFTVSELAFSLKRTVEETFGHVRVRGELGRVTVAKSGHCYLDIKDDKAVINSIVWKGVMSRLSMRPEEGMEVVCEGKLSTYPGRSNYQLIIDKMELAGAGALMALFEKRKKMLAAEGLFDQARKVDLPFMPKTIGVVTSPTGSVIRDILHRISDRFPSHVLVWPVLVQGDRAAEQIASAITGFNCGDGFPRPDVLIVARGGGSMEDLWCFNEEIVARAAAASDIPLISAVGHETDWTLIDYVADYRAPTPTGAAEVAVPVRDDWLETIADYGLRLTRGLRRNVREKQAGLAAARLPRLQSVLSPVQQRLDLASARLPAPTRLFEPLAQKLALQRLPSPQRVVERAANALSAHRLPNLDRLLDVKRSQLSSLRLRAEPLQRDVERKEARVARATASMAMTAKRDIQRSADRLARAGKLLDAYSYQGVLARGYALVQNNAGDVVRSEAAVKAGDNVTLTFADGSRKAVIDGAASGSSSSKPKPKLAKKPKPKPTAIDQGNLF